MNLDAYPNTETKHCNFDQNSQSIQHKMKAQKKDWDSANDQGDRN